MEDNEEHVVVEEEGPVSSRAPTRRLRMRVPAAVEPVLAEGSGPTQRAYDRANAITCELRPIRP